MEWFVYLIFFVAETFVGIPGRFVKLEDTIEGFERIVSGLCDKMPESAFYMVGTIEEAVAKAEKMAKDAAAWFKWQIIFI